MTTLKYDVFTNVRDSVSRGLPTGTEKLQWVANTATLVYGERDALLVDTFMTKEANLKLIDWIKAHHVTLKYIYITHAHADHFFGAGMIKDAFDSAKIIATQATADGIPAIMTPSMISSTWEALFPGQLPDKISGADEVVTDSFNLEDHLTKIIEDGFTDTHDSTSLWVPDLKLIIAGDVAYNGIHAYLAETTRDARNNWIKDDQKMKQLHPVHVVAGHKVPEKADDPIILDQTIQYLEDFNRLAEDAQTPEALFEQMLALYPDFVNPGSLWSAAHSIIR